MAKFTRLAAVPLMPVACAAGAQAGTAALLKAPTEAPAVRSIQSREPAVALAWSGL